MGIPFSLMITVIVTIVTVVVIIGTSAFYEQHKKREALEQLKVSEIL